MSEEDEDIDELLDELSAIGPLPSEELKNKVDKKVQKQQEQEDKDNVPVGSLELIEDDIDVIPEPDQALELTPNEVPVKTEDVVDELTGQLKKAVGKFDKISEEILENYHKDREQAQKAIDHYFNTINSAPKVPRVYIEKLADVIRSKNEIAQTPIRLLDSITKFITATNKSNGIMINNVNQGGGIDASNLEDILKQAEVYEDEQ